ncbi:MAG: DUF3150 domain-containing protein [Spirochaetales bacterium]|nr:DUF3150 domain-containing protein [Spirochaetales bacterium]
MQNIQSDITILDNLLALNLDISLWSARRKMTTEDMGGAQLPPEDLASLGSKRIADPESLKVFSTLKSRAFCFLDRHGVRFMSGWAIPEDKAGAIVQELTGIRDEFNNAKEAFLADYDQSVQAWIAKHSQWADIIRNSTVGPDYVRARMSFKWQLFKVAPLMSHADQAAVLESGLAEEVTGLGSTLFREVANDAEDMWKRVYRGKSEVTHRALSPLKTLHAKLTGLSFVEPHVAPVADIIMSALNRMPRRGNINGPDLLMLQGLVCLLKDSDSLIDHAQSLIVGNSADSVLDSLLPYTPPLSTEDAAMDNPAMDVDATLDNGVDDEPVLPPILPQARNPEIPSYGLW